MNVLVKQHQHLEHFNGRSKQRIRSGGGANSHVPRVHLLLAQHAQAGLEAARESRLAVAVAGAGGSLQGGELAEHEP